MDALDRVRGVLRDDLSRRRVARERDEADVRAAHERIADGNSVAGDDLEHSGRNDLLRELDEAEHREGCLLGGLDDLDVSGRERRSDLPDRHVQRVVPRADAGDDPERLAPDHRRVALHVLAGRLPLQVPGGAGEEPQAVRHRARLVDRDPPRLADVLRLEPRELLGVLVDDVREREEKLHPILRGLPLPLAPRLPRSSDRLLDVLLRSPRHLGDDLAGRRVQDLHRLARRRVHELAAHEHLLLGYRNAHTTSGPGISAERIAAARDATTGSFV